MRRYTMAAGIALLSACASPDDGPSGDRRLVRIAQLELQQGNGHVVASVAAVLTWRDALVVVDRLESNIKVFDPTTGVLRQVIGRAGQGPGEFLAPDAAVALADGRLAVHDALLQRVSVFGPDGAFESSWPFVGVLSGGLSSTRNGTIVAAGRLLSETGVTSEFELHEFDVEGKLVASSESLPETEHFAEGNFNRLMVTMSGDRLVMIRRTTNLVREVDWPSSGEQKRRVGETFYRPPLWDLEPGDTPDDGLRWQRRQYLVWHLSGLRGGTYVVGFVGPDGAKQSSWWVVVHGDAGETILKASPAAGAGPAPGALLAIVDVTDSGVAVASLYDLVDTAPDGAL